MAPSAQAPAAQGHAAAASPARPFPGPADTSAVSATTSRGMADLPEPLLFTVEFDTGAAMAIGRATQGPAQAPPVPSLPLPAVALPREVELLIEDPEGLVKLTVGRERRDVSVRVEVPTGLLPAIQEARQPVRAALAHQGLDLGRYDVSGGQQGPGGEQRDARGGRGRQPPTHGAATGRATASPAGNPRANRGLLDRRA